jgi:autotransporter-associated beta strand protein
MGAGGLTKIGAGTLRLTNGTNNYTGPTLVSGGTLQITTPGVAPGSNFTVQNGATLQIDAAGKTLQGLSVEGGATLMLPAVVAMTTTLTNALLSPVPPPSR